MAVAVQGVLAAMQETLDQPEIQETQVAVAPAGLQVTAGLQAIQEL